MRARIKKNVKNDENSNKIIANIEENQMKNYIMN